MAIDFFMLQRGISGYLDEFRFCPILVLEKHLEVAPLQDDAGDLHPERKTHVSGFASRRHLLIFSLFMSQKYLRQKNLCVTRGSNPMTSS